MCFSFGCKLKIICKMNVSFFFFYIEVLKFHETCHFTIHAYIYLSIYTYEFVIFSWEVGLEIFMYVMVYVGMN